MGTKEFAWDARGYVLMGDERDVGVATWYRDEVWAWCDDKNIVLEYQGSMAGIDLWRIKDEKHRMWFRLRWMA